MVGSPVMSDKLTVQCTCGKQDRNIVVSLVMSDKHTVQYTCG